jgi:uncharacterized integral membrane protein
MNVDVRWHGSNRATKGKTPMKRDKKKVAKLIAMIVIAAMAVIIFLQNTETVETHILLVTVRMSRALLLILTFILGFLSGLLVAGNFLRRKKA